MFKTADMIDDSRVRSTRKGEISNVTNKQIDLEQGTGKIENRTGNGEARTE